MTIFQILLFMFVILPGILIRTGWELLAEIINENDWKWNIPYILLLAFILIAIVLWTSGFH